MSSVKSPTSKGSSPKSPKPKSKAQSKKAAEHEDNQLLDEHISKHKLKNRTELYLFVALTVTILPSYLFQAVMDMEWGENMLFFIVVPLCSAVALTFAYHKYFQSTYLHQQLLYPDTWPTKKSDNDENATQRRETLRFQAAMGKALGFCNLVYLVVVLVLQHNLLKAFPKTVNYTVSIALASALVYWLAQKNEKTVQQKRERIR
eukprot:NODE_468_length_817_cov_30.036232_g459_i0.p1 GENE.NODE_468_length_817_cov_30.036232_g459_i0~~NODE_468_length_817_cov_30.036232_g459_i0.p1  ORF type:complete len:204 (+),score=41.24 NODE_468_length_817_cov_30.036232_g459_i0:44-655(+)